MKKSIYKITNLINGKIYVGQSKNVQKRWNEHCHYSKSENSLIDLAIYKYGKENFSLEILEENIENYNEREKYWIQKLNSLVPNGYNILPGGEEPPIIKGIRNNNTTHTLEQVEEVKQLLKNTDLTTGEIGALVGYDYSAVDRINKGIMWNDPNETYPIRKNFTSDEICQRRWKEIVWMLKNTDEPQWRIAELCDVKRSAVTMINIGKNGTRWNDGSITYPIRSKKKHK